MDIIYLKFENRLLNRIVYLDNTIVERGTILLPIDNKIEYVPFALKYTTARKNQQRQKQTVQKHQRKHRQKQRKNNGKTDKTTPTKTKTPKRQRKQQTKKVVTE